jgi:hypothetical protein
MLQNDVFLTLTDDIEQKKTSLHFVSLLVQFQDFSSLSYLMPDKLAQFNDKPGE